MFAAIAQSAEVVHPADDPCFTSLMRASVCAGIPATMICVEKCVHVSNKEDRVRGSLQSQADPYITQLRSVRLL